jgi:CRP-like cAMP-binding protein
MAQPQQSAYRNRLLSGLSSEDRDLLQPSLEPISLELRYMLVEAGQAVEHVTFIEQGITSVLADTSEGRFEVGMIGPEGLVGLPVLFGIDHTPHCFMVQAAGEGHRIATPALRAALAQSPTMQAWFMRYAHAWTVQVTQTAYANAGFELEARLARWILMTQDRLGQDELPLTHEFLSMMLGMRRAGVTVAVQVLEGNGLIRAKRGRITVLNRPGLEEVADAAYGFSEAEYAKVMAMPDTGRA